MISDLKTSSGVRIAVGRIRRICSGFEEPGGIAQRSVEIINLNKSIVFLFVILDEGS